MEHELLPLSSESWTDSQQDPCTLTVTQGFAEHTSLPVDGENWEEGDFADPIDRFRTSVRTTTWQRLEAWRRLGDHPNILVRDQRKIVWMSLPSWIVLLIALVREKN